MPNLIHFNLPGNPTGLPLFKWADARTARHHRPVGYAARIISSRYRVPPARAALVAELAGFAMEAR